MYSIFILLSILFRVIFSTEMFKLHIIVIDIFMAEVKSRVRFPENKWHASQKSQFSNIKCDIKRNFSWLIRGPHVLCLW